MTIHLPDNCVSIDIKAHDESARININNPKIGPAVMEIRGPVHLTGSYSHYTQDIETVLAADCLPEQLIGLDVAPEYEEGDIINWMDKHFLITEVGKAYRTICLETENPFFFGLHYANKYAMKVD